MLAELDSTLGPLLGVGLSYLTLDRAGASLSTGERQRMELTLTVRASTTGMLYVLDEPSVGLHPVNVRGLHKTIAGLAANGNSVVMVEHERELIRSADWVIELGSGGGANGGTLIAQGTPRQLEWKPGQFSFNARAGQCPACRGLGHVDLDVQYLPDIPVQCPACHGARFNDATLAVRIDGLTIADVLGLSVQDALGQFGDRAPVAAALRPVSDIGLGYLRLGEPTPSLSGGESQRLRIASRLRSSQRGALYIFDEPSTGLHPRDVATLTGVFDRLLDAGATIIVIDHDLDLLAAADHVIDMGPGGGPDGGRILSAGSPEDVARSPGSVTGPWLADHLSSAAARQPGSQSQAWAG